ncbi:hypothetical protein [Primorskyibacter sp. S187A]|uniref:hypothetical protein n=1 Tax=Primorskyibacter sp. S187A TaxID=3415130 RepID=UPI003C7B13F9
MTFKGVFVEDNDTEAVFAKQLSTKGILELEHERPRPVSQHSKELFATHPDILVLDFRLDLDLGEMDASEAYKGSAMAQQIRDLAVNEPQHDFPIVLVSSEEKIREQFVPDRTSHDLFDKVSSKEHVTNQRAHVRQELVSLCAGYETLRGKVGAFDICDLTELPTDEDYALDYQDLAQAMKRASAPHLVAAVFLKQLLGRSGPLVGLFDACARLGVSKDEAPKIADMLRDDGISYGGLFSEGWLRFWSHRLDDFSRKIFGGRATGFSSEERAEKLSKACGVGFSPALSPWTGKADELIAFACSCCSEGTEMRHSVGVFEMELPSYSVRRRICWRCIHDDSYLHATPPFVIDDADASVVEEVKKLEKPV